MASVLGKARGVEVVELDLCNKAGGCRSECRHEVGWQQAGVAVTQRPQYQLCEAPAAKLYWLMYPHCACDMRMYAFLTNVPTLCM
jgi:hypothetical protein